MQRVVKKTCSGAWLGVSVDDFNLTVGQVDEATRGVRVPAQRIDALVGDREGRLCHGIVAVVGRLLLVYCGHILKSVVAMYVAMVLPLRLPWFC